VNILGTSLNISNSPNNSPDDKLHTSVLNIFYSKSLETLVFRTLKSPLRIIYIEGSSL